MNTFFSDTSGFKDVKWPNSKLERKRRERKKHAALPCREIIRHTFQFHTSHYDEAEKINQVRYIHSFALHPPNLSSQHLNM
jgi:hypothetical protein